MVGRDDGDNNIFGLQCPGTQRPNISADDGASKRQTLGIDIGRRSWWRGLTAARSWVEAVAEGTITITIHTIHGLSVSVMEMS